MAMYFILSDEEINIERETFTLLDALSNTGGIMGILMGLLKIIMGSIQQLFFSASVAKKLLFTTQDKSQMQPKKAKIGTSTTAADLHKPTNSNDIVSDNN